MLVITEGEPINKRTLKTHCKYGHEYTEPNTYIAPKSGARWCLACKLSQSRLYSKTHKDASRKAAKKWKDKLFFGGNREAAISRDGSRCVECGMTRQEHRDKYGRDITVDHIDGLGRNSTIKNNDLTNLQTLCLECHGSKDGVRQRGRVAA